LPRRVTTLLSSMGLTINGRGCICCATAREKLRRLRRKTRRAENRKREERDTSIPLEQKLLMVSSELWDSEMPVGKIQQLWLCKEYCSFNDLHVK
jgi:hypothetical protein